MRNFNVTMKVRSMHVYNVILLEVERRKNLRLWLTVDRTRGGASASAVALHGGGDHRVLVLGLEFVDDNLTLKLDIGVVVNA